MYMHVHFLSLSHFSTNNVHVVFLESQCTRIEAYFGLVGDTQWAEEIATTFANHMIVACPTVFERGQLLHLLAKRKFGENFTCQS